MMFKKRLGPNPHEGGGQTGAASGCPDLWELESGDIAIIGIRKTTLLKQNLPESAGCGIDEEIVVIPREVLIKARNDIEKL